MNFKDFLKRFKIISRDAWWQRVLFHSGPPQNLTDFTIVTAEGLLKTRICMDCLTSWQSTVGKETVWCSRVYLWTYLKQCRRSCFLCRFIWIMTIEIFVNEVSTLVTIYKVVLCCVIQDFHLGRCCSVSSLHCTRAQSCTLFISNYYVDVNLVTQKFHVCKSSTSCLWVDMRSNNKQGFPPLRS